MTLQANATGTSILMPITNQKSSRWTNYNRALGGKLNPEKSAIGTCSNKNG